jgi:hypothetical protein
VKERGGILFWLVSGAGELCWLYAWAAFSTIGSGCVLFPFSASLLTMLVAALLARWVMGRGFRVFWILLIHVIGFACAALVTVSLVDNGTWGFISRPRLIQVFVAPRSTVEWFYMALTLFWSLLFWIGGIGLARRSKTYYAVCSRFDIGLAAFFLLFLAKLVLAVKEGTVVDESCSWLLLFPFLLFSLLSIGMARGGSGVPKDFLPGHRGIGVVGSFVALVMLLAGGLVLFFLPALTAAARAGGRLFTAAARPAGSLFLYLLTFFFVPKSRRAPEPAGGGMGYDGSWPSWINDSWWGDLVSQILGWGLGAMMGLVLLVIVAILGLYLFRWLFSRTAVRGKKVARPIDIRLWFHKTGKLLGALWQKMKERLRGKQQAAHFFNALQSWGSRSGHVRLPNETPGEFGARLGFRFPKLESEIAIIVHAFNHEIYGGVPPTKSRLESLGKAWGRLLHPVHWASRLRARWGGFSVLSR